MKILVRGIWILAALLCSGTLWAVPQRIVSLTPCATDILGELGVSRELVGITRYCKAPEGSAPRVIGGFIDPSAEAVLALKPDLLVHADVRDRSFVNRMSGYGIPCVILFPESYENIKRDVVLLGEKTGRRERADCILKEWGEAEDAIRLGLEKRPILRRPRVLILWGEVCAGKTSYLNDIIELCGGINAAPEKTPRAWPILTKELLVGTRAEILIYVAPDGPSKLSFMPNLADSLKKNPAFALLPAVKTRKIFTLGENSRLLYPTPSLRRALPQIAQAIRRSTD